MIAHLFFECKGVWEEFEFFKNVNISEGARMPWEVDHAIVFGCFSSWEIISWYNPGGSQIG